MRLIIILLALATYLNVSGQAANQVFSSDTVTGDETKYLTGTKESHIYQGIAGFVFTTANDNDSIFFEGCYNTNAWYSIDTVVATGSASVNREVFQSPPQYKYYRLRLKGEAGDTCYFSNARYYLKY